MENNIANIYIGYDSRIPVAFNVLAHSITANSTIPVRIMPINYANIKQYFTRDVDPLQSTEFSFSRFLTPFLSDYQGWSIFMDNDMVYQDDIKKLWDLRDDKYAAMCVKHDHQPKEEAKFMGAKQTQYGKKNWSSLILFNNAKCKALTPDYVNTATGLQLHQFKWLENDDLIGEVPPTWNYLAGYNEGEEKPACVHYTEGGPFYPDYADTFFAKEWFEAYKAANYCKEADFEKLTQMARDKT